MNRATRTLCRFLLACFLTGIMVFPVRSSAMTKPPKMAGLPIPFVEQPGQHIQFTARTLGGSATVTPDGQIRYALTGKGGKNYSLTETPVGALHAPGIKGQGLLKARATVFHGKHSRKTLRLFERVSLGDITRGIGLSLRAYGSNVEKLYTVRPGADPATIRMKITGGMLSVNEKDELVVMTAQGPVSFTAPVAYQEDAAGGRQAVSVAYNTLNENEYGFSVGSYDRARALVIDPLLASTYLGGSATNEEEVARDIALDAEGNIYVAGTTPSADFPVTDGAALSGTTDGFISKFNPDLSELLAATFIGGNGYDTICSMVVDNGKVYVAAHSNSADCPVTDGAYSEVTSGQNDIYLCVIDTSLTTLEAATYLGGSDYEQRPELVLGSGGDIYVTMETASTDFPMVSPDGKTPYQSTLSHSKNYYSDIAIARLSGDLTTLKASTFLGGSGSTYGYGYENCARIALAASGDVWIAGITGATDFPTTEGAYRTAIADGGDYVFLSRLDADLTDLKASTYLGRSYSNWMVALALADDGDVYVAGRTYSDEPWPVTDGAYDTDGTTGNKSFISRLDSDLTGLEASTLLGGTLNTSGPESRINDMLLDSTGQVIVAGITSCSDFPTTENAYDRTADSYYVQSSNRSNPFFIAKLTGDLTGLTAGTYLGNEVYGPTSYTAVALDSSDNVYLCGKTASPYFPTTDGAFDTSFNNDQYNGDAFVAKLDSDLSRDAVADLALSADVASLSVTAGDEISFTLIVENQGPDAADAVILTSTLPDGFTFVSATPDQGTAAHNAGVIICEMGTIAASATAGVSIVVQAPDSAGDIDATASVSAATIDTSMTNNTLDIAMSVTAAASSANDDNSICFISTARQ